MGKRLVRIALMLAVVLVLDWGEWAPPYPLHRVAQVKAQQPIPPPSAWHPYRGGVNCVQVADANGNFSCSPLVTINPATGVLSLTGGSTGTQTFPGVVVAALGSSYQTLGTGDLVISRSASTVAPAGPGLGAVTLRVRPSPVIPGYCRVVAIAGTAFGTEQEFPLAFMNPAYDFLAVPAGGGITFGNSYVVDIPGGPGGC